MGEVLKLSKLVIKGNKIEQKGGEEPSRARLSGPTAQSLRINERNNKIEANIEKWNEKYSQLYNAVVSAEVAAAEQEVRDSIMKERKDAPVENTNEKVIAEDNAIAKSTRFEVAKKKFEKLKISNDSLKNRFGSLGENFGVNVKKGFSPKALSVPLLYAKIYGRMLHNADMYKMDSVIEKQDEPVEEKGVIANWRNLFDGVETKTNEVVVAMDSHEEEQEPVAENNRHLTEDELSRRILQARAGEELAEIRKLKSNTNGLASPFSNGLIEREQSVLRILANSTGVESIADKVVESKSVNDNTEFQNLIEKIVGYKDPITQKEHDEEEIRMQAYYSDPEVSNIIDELRHKDMLYSYNQPDFYSKIQEAERKDNQRIAENSKAIDVIDNDENLNNDEIYNKMVELSAANRGNGDKKNGTTNRFVIDDNSNELEGNDESTIKQDTTLIRAQEDEITQKMIKDSAAIEARNIQQKLDMEMIMDSAPKQAAMLKTLNDYMEKQEKLEKANEEERRMILNGAREQAIMLQRNYENAQLRKMIKDSAIIEARNIQQKLDMEMIMDSAPKQAAMLKTLNDYMEKQEKLEKANEEERRMILNGAREQAIMLQRKYERDVIVESAQEEAKKIVAETQKAIVEERKNGEAIASQIVHENVNQVNNKNQNREITWIDSRYATLNSFSKALRIHPSQNANIRKRIERIYGSRNGYNYSPKIKVA